VRRLSLQFDLEAQERDLLANVHRSAVLALERVEPIPPDSAISRARK